VTAAVEKQKEGSTEGFDAHESDLVPLHTKLLQYSYKKNNVSFCIHEEHKKGGGKGGGGERKSRRNDVRKKGKEGKKNR